MRIMKAPTKPDFLSLLIYLIRGAKTLSKKDGLMKMVLFTNISEIKAGSKAFTPHAELKLTSDEKVELHELC